jgi:hypothetical protein
MQLSRKTNITKQDIEVAGQSYVAVNQSIYLGSHINSKNSIQEEIRIRIKAGKRNLFANKKLLKNKDLNAASKLQIYKTIIRHVVTYVCETWTMTVTEQNRLLVFEIMVLRKIYGPTVDMDGTWSIKTNEELEHLIKKKYYKLHKITKITLGSTCNRNEHNKNSKKFNNENHVHQDQ